MKDTADATRRSAIVERTREHVRELFENEGTGHDYWHIDRVRVMALRLADEEGADAFVVELAALLHDIADWKFHHGDLTAGPRRARAWLTELETDPAVVDHVVEIIENVSFKGAGVGTPMRTVEGSVVQDADRLDAIGAIGIARTFAYGGHRNQPIHDPRATPEPHESFEAYRDSAGGTICHFHEKLLLLRDRMHTDAARRIAEERHRYMEAFLERFHREWEGLA